jgi:hypothetical protein
MDQSSFGLFLLPGGRPRRFTAVIQAGGRPRRLPRPATSRSKTRIASASLSRSARNSASMLLVSILVGYRVLKHKSDSRAVRNLSMLPLPQRRPRLLDRQDSRICSFSAISIHRVKRLGFLLRRFLSCCLLVFGALGDSLLDSALDDCFRHAFVYSFPHGFFDSLSRSLLNLFLRHCEYPRSIWEPSFSMAFLPLLALRAWQGGESSNGLRPACPKRCEMNS